MNSKALSSFLYDATNGCETILMDKEYSLPDEGWIAGDFAAALARDLLATNQATYVPESNDCDKFAWFAVAIAHACNARTQMGRALAFGLFGYTRDASGTGHEINIAVTGTADAPKVVFFEPQTQKIVSLSANEIASIYTIIM